MAKPESKTVTVIHTGLADYKTIGDALKVCDEGDTIIVKIGQYDETVVLDKSVHILGEADTPSDIRITGGVVCNVGGSIKNLSVQGLVDVRAGDVLIEGCDIFQGADGIRVQKDANPTIKKNTIHDAHQGGDGIYFADGAKGTVTDNEIFNNRMNGIHVNNSEVTITGNKIHDCPYGVFYRKGGRGTCERNTISDVPSFGVYICSGSEPLIISNQIMSCGIHGVMVSTDGKGTIKDNNINGNISIKRGCNPVLGPNMVAGRIDNENTMPVPEA